MPSRRADRGTWEAGVIFNGKRYRKQFPTKREAAEWEIEKRRELERGEKKPTLLGFVGFASQYMAEVQLRHTVKTVKEKKALCERLIEAWGDMEVSAITSNDIRSYLNRQAEKRSNNAANKDRKNLLAMWNWGQRFLDIPSNPVIKTPPLPHDQAQQYTPSTQDVLALLLAASKAEKVFLQAYLNTGARRSEIFRWTWHEDINFDRREVRLGTRKTRDGSMEYEWLPMTDTLYDELWWWWSNKTMKNSPYVFPSEHRARGSHYGGQYVERRWFLRTLCKRAGVKYFGFHALRRYVASILADTHKVSSKVIQRVLRHKNVGTTERYVKRLHSDLRATMELLKTDIPPLASTSEKEAAE